MKIRHRFNLQGTLDPFTLLKVSQAYREMDFGEAMEFSYAGQKVPQELFKVLPRDGYRIVEEDSYQDPPGCRIVLEKRKRVTPGPGERDKGCSCR